MELFRSFGELGSILSYVTLARIKDIQGDYAEAQEIVDQARHLAQNFEASQMDDELVESYQVQLWLSKGEIQRAQRWVAEKQLAKLVKMDSPSARFDPVWEIRSQTLARVYMSQSDYQSALQVIEPLLETAKLNQRLRNVIKVLAMQAVMHYRLGDTDKALEIIDQAMDLSEEEGFIRTFLDEGELMARLLYEAAAKGYHAEYSEKLLRNFASEGRLNQQEIDHSGLVEPLSRREIEVLTLIADGRSNQEIAGLLHISLSTVKVIPAISMEN